MYTDYVDENEQENENVNEEENYYSDDNNNNDNKEKIKKIAFYVIIFCVALIIIVLIAKGCSNRKNNNVGDDDNSITASIVINRKNITLAVGEEFTLTGDVLNSGDDDPVIVWHSEDTEIATINDDGVVLAQKEGETTIVASYGDYETTCEVIVTEATIKATSIRITQGDITLKKGDGVLLQVEILPEGANENIIYASNNSSIATVSDTGYVNAIDVGKTTIIATSESGLTSEITVTVSSGSTKIDPTNLYLSGLNKELVVGETAQVISKIEPDNATNKSLTWSSSNSSIATVDSNGVVTGKSAGTCTIIASTSNNITARLEVVVHSNSIAVSGISITNGNAYSMKVSGIKKIQYTITPSNATNKKVTFQSSNTKVAVVDSNGLVAAVGAGTAVITVKTEDGNKTALITVNVTSNSSSSSTSNNTSNNTTNDTTNNNSSNNDNSNSTNSSTVVSTCSSYEMITVANNQKTNGTTVSNYSYSQAKPFLKTQPVPGVEVSAIADCVKDITYKIYYGADEDKVNSASYSVKGSITKVGQTINFNKGDGCYRLEVTGIDTGSNSELKKEYYAVVKTEVSSLTLKINKFGTNGDNIILLVSANSTVGLKNLRYCVTTSSSGCSNYTSNMTLSGKSATKTITIEKPTRVQTQYICAALFDTNGNKHEECFTIK